jgi:hypothetical protein
MISSVHWPNENAEQIFLLFGAPTELPKEFVDARIGRRLRDWLSVYGTGIVDTRERDGATIDFVRLRNPLKDGSKVFQSPFHPVDADEASILTL